MKKKARKNQLNIHTTKKGHQNARLKFSWWMGLLLVLIVGVVGFVILRFSEASNVSNEVPPVQVATSAELSRVSSERGNVLAAATAVTGSTGNWWKNCSGAGGLAGNSGTFAGGVYYDAGVGNAWG